jgi:hypothetical protein
VNVVFNHFNDRKDNMESKLTDSEKQFLFDCESNCGRDFPKCGNTNCERRDQMNQSLQKLWSYNETIATKC